MNHNKYNLKVGDRAVVDKKHPNSCEITIVRFTPNEMFVTIKDDDDYEWQTMTNRVTPIGLEVHESALDILTDTQREIVEGLLIKAAKYGYDFHKTSSFPEMEFEEAAINNFKQELTIW